MNSSRVALVCGFAAFMSVSLSATDHFVSLTGSHAPPFLNWSDAATNIQDAIDVASDDDVIWVTNGVYATGGKITSGNLTNRVALDKAVTVRSVNGPFVTAIQGAGATNGPLAVRCAWLTNGAALIGFTLKDGATRTAGNPVTNWSGGGAWCVSSNALIANCLITSNAAAGGVAVFGGTLNSCFVSGNPAGGVARALLNSCTIVSNFAGGVGVGASALTNCIVYYNSGGNYAGPAVAFSYCCTTPPVAGSDNISAPPQLASDGLHLTRMSPCRGAGTNLVTGTDIDGQAWSNPPSIGCDEWQPSPIIFAPAKTGTNFVFSFQTEAGKIYTPQYVDSLSTLNWQNLPGISGDGSVKTVTNSAPTVSQRFYRLIEQ